MSRETSTGPYVLNASGEKSDAGIWEADLDYQKERNYDEYLYLNMLREAAINELARRNNELARKEKINHKKNMEKLFNGLVSNQKINVFDVNLGVISQFRKCNEINAKVFKRVAKEVDFIDKNELIHKKISEQANNPSNYNECLDFLGVYIPPTDQDNANILISKEKIVEVAEKYKIRKTTLYRFVKIHEYAHAVMCPFLAPAKQYQTKRISSINHDIYTIIEESLATAIALKMFKYHTAFPKLLSFVENQPIQYVTGIAVFEHSEIELEALMDNWLMFKLYSDNVSSIELSSFL